MKAIVLVGGEGTRLRPLTFSTPKPMLPIVDVPMIERILAHLAAHGIDEVVLSMGYRPDAFLATFPDGKAQGIALTYAVEPEPLDTAGGIAFAARYAGLDVGSDRFLVVNGDVLTDLDITALAAFHAERGAEATIALTPVPNPTAFGVVPTDDNGLVTAFVEPSDAVKKGLEAPKEPPPTNLINGGFYVFEPAVIARIPENQKISIERVVFPQIVADKSLYALGSTEYWLDTGTAAQFLQANLDVIAGRRALDPVAPGATQRNDGSWIAGGPVIDGHIESPAYVGDAAYVGRDATIARSVVGAGARVEARAVVEGSVLLPGALIHANAVVRDSIVGEGAVIGAGASLSGVSVIQGGAEVGEGVALDGERVAAA